MSSAPKRILIAEDDTNYREMVEMILKKKGFEVKTAANGKLALQEFCFNPFDLVISDIKMPVMHGLDLLVEIKKRRPDCPVVLMTGFSYILETNEAKELGANDFIMKPFQIADFLKIVYEYCSPEVLKERKDQTSEYFSISIDDFVSGSKLLYDLHIRLTNFKYIKIAHKDEKIDPDIIAGYKAKGIKEFFITKEDFQTYLGFNMLIYQSMEGKKFAKETHARMIGNILDMFSSLAFEGALDESLMTEINGFCQKGFSLISDNSQLLDIMTILNEASSEQIAHCTSVSFISAAIAKKLQWYSKGTAHKLFLAAFLHDIGKKDLPPTLLKKETGLMTKAEFDEFKTHATRGKDILIELKCMPNDVTKAVYDHHEAFNGAGYPNGLKRDFIHPFARVIRIANDFCNYLYPKEGIKRKPQEVLQIMRTLSDSEYDPEFFKAFESTLKT